jgi:hypothetical protein
MMLRRVLFPDPDGPTTARLRPEGTSRLRGPSTLVGRIDLEPYSLTTSMRRISYLDLPSWAD